MAATLTKLLAQCVLFLATAAVSSGFRAFAPMPIAVQRARANGAVCLRMAEDASAVLARMQAMMNGAYTPAPAAYAPPRNANIRNAAGMEFVEPEPRMSGAVIHNGLIYTCGMVCEEGGESKDVTQQTKDALAELDRVLEKCGSDKHHILQMQVWVDELSYVPAMNAVYDEWVSKEGPPGRACVQSKLIPPYKVEFRVTAVKVK